MKRVIEYYNENKYSDKVDEDSVSSLKNKKEKGYILPDDYLNKELLKDGL